MPQDHANCAGPGVDAAINSALKPEIYGVLGIAVKEIAVLEDGRIVEERCCGAVGEVKANLDPSRYRCVGYPMHCDSTHSTHNFSMRIIAPVRTHSSGAPRNCGDSADERSCPARIVRLDQPSWYCSRSL